MTNFWDCTGEPIAAGDRIPTEELLNRTDPEDTLANGAEHPGPTVGRRGREKLYPVQGQQDVFQ